jgi:hypothetical protein
LENLCYTNKQKGVVFMDWTFWAAIIFIIIMIPIGISQSRKPSIPDNMLIARCPKCKSTAITANKQGFGVGKAAIGAVAVGPLGLLAGSIGSSDIKLSCLSCGNQWDNNGITAKMDRDLQKQEILTRQKQVVINQVSLQEKPTRYIKKSFVDKLMTDEIKNHIDDTEWIVDFSNTYLNNLRKENIKIVSDEEFTRITGKP